MKLNIKKNNLFILAASGLLLLILSCGNKDNDKVAEPVASFPVSKIQLKTVTGYQEYPTNIEGVVNSDVRAKTSGYIQKVLIDEGQKVRKGQILFQLETQSLSQDAGAAKARINVAQVEVDKLIPLVEKNIISSIQLESAKANLNQAKANYSGIVATINYATIKSPINGYVGAINFREGALISTTDVTPLTKVSEIDKVYAFFSFNEAQYINHLQRSEGKTKSERINNYPDVSLVLPNGKIYSETGRIQTSTGQINQSTGTITIRATFNNPNEILSNGNSGKIRIPIEYKDAIVVPQSATFEQQKDILIYTLDKDNKAKATIIKVQDIVGNLYVIKSGLKEGDKIIISGVGKLKNGTPILPQETSFDQATKPVTTSFKN
jgi:membrane fusion protein (multidrug efflux system)